MKTKACLRRLLRTIWTSLRQSTCLKSRPPSIRSLRLTNSRQQSRLLKSRRSRSQSRRMRARRPTALTTPSSRLSGRISSASRQSWSAYNKTLIIYSITRCSSNLNSGSSLSNSKHSSASKLSGTPFCKKGRVQECLPADSLLCITRRRTRASTRPSCS